MSVAPVLLPGDCMAWLPQLPESSFDACVTDPPYHLTPIVKRFGKPGSAPAKSNGETGVYGRASAGFMGQQWDGGDIAFRPETWGEVLRVLKPGAHLVAFGGSRTYHRLACAIEDAGFEIRDQIMWLYGSGFPKSHNQKGDWEGWGTALKPSHEPVVLARKPFKGTAAKNLAEHGTAALHIDPCRVGFASDADEAESKAKNQHADFGSGPMTNRVFGLRDRGNYDPEGRWPANVCHDGSDEVLDALGEPARFFYCSKASRKDRNDGNNHPTVKPTALMQWLCRLVTPEGGAILDPFMGSGSTGKAALREGFRFAGIEQSEDYMNIARARIAAEEEHDDTV